LVFKGSRRIDPYGCVCARPFITSCPPYLNSSPHKTDPLEIFLIPDTGDNPFQAKQISHDKSRMTVL
jgi:hypothetical protein